MPLEPEAARIVNRADEQMRLVQEDHHDLVMVAALQHKAMRHMVNVGVGVVVMGLGNAVMLLVLVLR